MQGFEKLWDVTNCSIYRKPFLLRPSLALKERLDGRLKFRPASGRLRPVLLRILGLSLRLIQRSPQFQQFNAL